MSRFIKQTIYGVFYLAIIGFVGYGIYFLTIQPAASCFDNRKNQGELEIDCDGPCQSCEIKNLSPIQAAAAAQQIDGAVNVVISFSNPNFNYGADSFNYTLNIKDAFGAILLSLKKISFIYPAELSKIVIESNLKVNFSQISGNPEVLVESVAWKPIAEFTKPQTDTRQIKLEIAGKTAIVTGLLSNRESSELSRATIGAFVKKRDGGEILGVSKTILQNIRPFEERAFKIIVPITSVLKLSELETQITVEARR